MTLKSFLSGAIAAGVLFASASVVTAQGLFSPAVTINDKAVTWYEIQQRAQFYKVIRRLGNLEDIAKDDLVEDRLKLQAGDALGVSISPDELKTGMDEFAGRANLKSEQFIAALAKEGVEAQTFRDFVHAGLVWRQVVNARFRGRVQISDAEVDAAIGTAGQAGLRVLLSEVIIPLTPENQEQAFAVANEISGLTSFAAFSEAATRFSAARSRENGGRLEWLPLTRLPGPIQPVVLGLKPGEVSAPLELDSAIAVFQMRAIEELPRPDVPLAAIEYGLLRIAGGRSPEALAQAQRIRNSIDTCDDLYGVNLGGPDEALTVESRVPSEIPRDIALELAKLDRHEISTSLTSSDGSQLLLVMMCGRTAAINEEASRTDVLNALRNRRLASYADGYLEQLRSEASIVEK